LRFAPFGELETRGIEPNRAAYKLAYAAPFTDRVEFSTDRQNVLNRLFERFNTDRPADFTGRSMSVSDVIVLRSGGGLSAHYVDRTGFAEIGKSDFYGKPADDITQAQPVERKPKPAEQTFLQVAKRFDETPALEELASDVKAGKSVSVMELAKAANAKKGKPSILAGLEENKILAARHNKSAGRKTTRREVE
jgi:hypothetical protein